MAKKRKIILISMSISIILIIIFGVFKLMNGGFMFLTYATDNYLEIQLEEFLFKESGQDYKDKITIIGEREYDNGTLIFYKINTNDNMIVYYENVTELGKYKVFSMDRVIKSDNSIAMIDVYDNNRRKYIILSSLDKDEFTSINIVSTTTNKILEQIELEKSSEDEFKIEELDDKSIMLEYIPKANVELKLELNKKSGN
ncbi:hypothetical protein H8S20_05700 [Clostridium sp. NSJ-6]|uniref:Membrane associated protein n=1 Tax=Clostridium hominis TaxID=2763036 RepID=A0ABR7DAM7_9CLOT|nr:hypothetical protein [Clostridium hominis]MBC5628387.1 hypothetical protein [Clostridium hominis]MDU2671146.1 hypothetical protein [Clostridium sp.]